MRHWLDCGVVGELADPGLLVAIGRDAETAGWDGFSLWEVLHLPAAPAPAEPVIDPWVVLAALAAATGRIRLATMVSPIHRKQPWHLARTAATLDRLSGGRFTLGVGIGRFPPGGHAAPDEGNDPRLLGDRLDESLAIVAGLWTGEPFAFTGQHFRLETTTLLPTPQQRPRIPIWVGGFWPNSRPFRRAARWDGVIPGSGDRGWLTPAEIREVRAYITEHRSEPTPFPFAVVAGGDTDWDAPDAARAVMRAYAEAGITDWVEEVGDWPGTLEEKRARIRRGPLRIDG